MLSTSDKIQIELFFWDLGARIAERQYSFIMNFSAISAGAVFVLFKETINDLIFVKLSFIFFLASFISSIFLNVLSPEFDRKILDRDKDAIEKAYKGDFSQVKEQFKLFKKILSIFYYVAVGSFVIGIFMIAIYVIDP